jgi:hypothetical protein
LVAELLCVAVCEASASCGGEFVAALPGGLDADLGGGDTGLHLLLNVAAGRGHQDPASSAGSWLGW